MAHQSQKDHANSERLAEGECRAVDLCQCGTLQLHLGDLSLRLSPDVAHSVLRTLAAALARRQALLAERANAAFATANWSGGETPRGKA